MEGFAVGVKLNRCERETGTLQNHPIPRGTSEPSQDSLLSEPHRSRIEVLM